MEVGFRKDDEGNVTYNIPSLYTSNLEEAQESLRSFFGERGGKLKDSGEWHWTDHVTRWKGWYSRMSFKDQFFIKGFLITILGQTSPIEACYSNPDYTPDDSFVTEIVRRDGSVDNYHAINGRAARLSDRGHLEITVEGYSPDSQESTPLHDVLQLNAPLPLLTD